MTVQTNATAQKLLQALDQFHRAKWHEQQTFAGCKPSEIRVLFCIKNGAKAGAPMKVSEISKQMHVTSPTITQLLNGLEPNGLVERQIDPEDRRSVGIRLTEKGERVTEQAGEGFLTALQGLIDYLGEEDSERLTDLLFKVLHYMEERQASAHQAHWSV
ncbi:MAG TPA: MarR family transcriptional regulator [Ktedonobacteraceae bacterium]